MDNRTPRFHLNVPEGSQCFRISHLTVDARQSLKQFLQKRYSDLIAWQYESKDRILIIVGEDVDRSSIIIACMYMLFCFFTPDSEIVQLETESVDRERLEEAVRKLFDWVTTEEEADVITAEFALAEAKARLKEAQLMPLEAGTVVPAFAAMIIRDRVTNMAQEVANRAEKYERDGSIRESISKLGKHAKQQIFLIKMMISQLEQNPEYHPLVAALNEKVEEAQELLQRFDLAIQSVELAIGHFLDWNGAVQNDFRAITTTRGDNSLASKVRLSQSFNSDVEIAWHKLRAVTEAINQAEVLAEEIESIKEVAQQIYDLASGQTVEE